MVDVTMSDQYRIDLTKQSTAIPEQVDARFARIDQQMPPLNQKQAG